jgi:hypothetical protein
MGFSNQPPVNPALSSPRRRSGSSRITRHTSPERWFSIIARIGPWSMPR